jgi:hypothetical protein
MREMRVGFSDLKLQGLTSVPDTEGIVLPYEDIKGKRADYAGSEVLGIHQAYLEAYLSDEEFVRVFAMTKPLFYSLDNDSRRKKLLEADLQ